MFWIEIVEGKDAPSQIWSNRIKGTIGLLLRACQSLASSGKIVVLNSGFCVLKALIELRKIGVYAAAVIKKRRYWPKFCPGDMIDEYMKSYEIGNCTSLRGTIDGIPYDIFCLKEPDYVMKLFATYGGLLSLPGQRETVRIYRRNGENVTKKFKYTEPFANHFLIRHAIDDHNNLRHQLPSIEVTWVTHRWAVRVFSFILAISEVNTYLAMKYFIWDTDKICQLHNFRQELAFKLINNEWLNGETKGKMNTRTKKRDNVHTLQVAPKYATRYSNGAWKCESKSRYQQFICKVVGCKKQVRSYCSCSPGQWLCASCHVNHVIEEIQADDGGI